MLMVSRKKDIEPKLKPYSPALQEIDTGNLEQIITDDDMHKSFSERAREQLPLSLFNIVKRIAQYISEGLTLEEACLLANTSVSSLEESSIKFPIIEDLLRFMELSLKRDLLRTLLAKAKGGNEKHAQWFLERKYPEEFGRRRMGQGSIDDDGGGVKEALIWVRDRNDGSSMVNRNAGLPVPTKRNPGILKEVRDFLK